MLHLRQHLQTGCDVFDFKSGEHSVADVKISTEIMKIK